MKVLVTGATGFLGGWLVRRLINDGHSVRITQRTTSSLDDISGPSVEVVTGDVTDVQSMIAACKGIDTVFHLAGLIAYSRFDRPAMEKVNVGGTANVVTACLESRVRKLVYLSSVVAIGSSFDQVPLTENSPYNLAHLNLGYFETKRKAEKIVVNATETHELDAVIINPSTVYGAADAKKGSRGTQLKVAQGRFPLYPPGGVNIVAVEDVIEGIVRVWQKGRTGERYIMAGENLLLKDVFALIAAQAGVKPPKFSLPRSMIFALGRFGDALESLGRKGPLNSETAWTSTLYHWFDARKAREELGMHFKPAEFAIENSVRWMRDHGLLQNSILPTTTQQATNPEDEAKI